ncbi:hypothetical protein TNCV_4599701 [Trichonephila clavipes]|nr:hypothetical protein TNCV_4599701 [Trichonephila clavipes]
MDCKGICKEDGFTLTWVFENFRYCGWENGACILSPAIAKGKNDPIWWILELYPKGFDIKSKGISSIFISTSTVQISKPLHWHGVKMECQTRHLTVA